MVYVCQVGDSVRYIRGDNTIQRINSFKLVRTTSLQIEYVQVHFHVLGGYFILEILSTCLSQEVSKVIQYVGWNWNPNIPNMQLGHNPLTQCVGHMPCFSIGYSSFAGYSPYQTPLSLTDICGIEVYLLTGDRHENAMHTIQKVGQGDLEIRQKGGS